MKNVVIVFIMSQLDYLAMVTQTQPPTTPCHPQKGVSKTVESVFAPACRWLLIQPGITNHQHTYRNIAPSKSVELSNAQFDYMICEETRWSPQGNRTWNFCLEVQCSNPQTNNDNYNFLKHLINIACIVKTHLCTILVLVFLYKL